MVIRQIVITIQIFVLSTMVYSQIEGNYKSKNLSIGDRINILIRDYHFVGGNDLVINADSTYDLTTCSIIQEGTWSVKSDSLFLFSDTTIYRNDSIETANPFYKIQGRKRPIKYYIDNNVLFREYFGKDGNEIFLVKEFLIKE